MYWFFEKTKNKLKEAGVGPFKKTYFDASLGSYQYGHNGGFLNFLGDNLNYKSSPNIWWLWDIFKTSLVKKNCFAFFWGTFYSKYIFTLDRTMQNGWKDGKDTISNRHIQSSNNDRCHTLISMQKFRSQYARNCRRLIFAATSCDAAS